MNYWLFKSEPESFSIDDLVRAPGQRTCWDGVRNYQARNFLRDSVKLGDRVLYYHSGGDKPAVVGTATVVREGYPDHTAWKASDHHFDEKASPANPIWQMVDIKLERVFPRPITLGELRGEKSLDQMELLRRGSRLSVQPVREAEFRKVLEMSMQAEPLTAGRTAVRRAGRKKKVAKNPADKKQARKPKRRA